MTPAPIDADDWSDDEPTLVHAREVTEIRVVVPRPRPYVAPIPPPLPLALRRVQRELAPDDLWLASLPAATRAMLDRARRGHVGLGRVASPVSAA